MSPASFISAIGLAVAAGAASFAAIAQGPACDPQGRNEALSDDGRYRATWRSEACHGLRMFTDFDSRVTVSRVGAAGGEEPVLVFESDGPDDVVIGWRPDDVLHIELQGVASVRVSERKALGINVTYGVEEGVLDRINSSKLSFLGMNDSSETEQISFSDQMIIRLADKDFSDYMADFKRWAAAYAEVRRR